jgi:plasmid stabilization system protein ParE
VPQVIITRRAARGLESCRIFLANKSPEAAQRAAGTITQKIMLLEEMPDVGRPVPGYVGRRELTMEFGNSGYVALYHHDPAKDKVYILAFRHQKEGGYL